MVLLGAQVRNSGAVRTTALARANTAADARDDPVERALTLRRLADHLDLSHRHVLQLSVVLCRHGPTVWLPVDLAWLAAVHQEARARGLPVGAAHLLTEYGWRDDRGNAATRPLIPPSQQAWW